GRDLQLRRRSDPVLSVRVSNRIELRLLNDGPHDLEGVLRDEPPTTYLADRKEFPLRLRAGEEQQVVYHVTPPERGSDYFRGTFLRLKCPFGLVEKQVRLSTEQPVRVYPNVLALREFDLLQQRGRLNQIGIRFSRTRGLGTEFESLRDYGEGDDFRKIDWKASARKNKLVVKQFEQERSQSVLICIDTGRRMFSEVNGVTKLDHALDSLLLLAHAAALAGDFIGLLVYSDVVKRYIPPRKGRAQVGAIIEATHDLTAEPVESDPLLAFSYLQSRYKKRSLLVSFTDVDDPEEAKRLTAAVGPVARRHLCLLARVGDPNLKELTEGSLDELDDLYLRAGALLFSEQRQAAAGVLESARIHSLEAEPQDLAGALVSFYFQVKERSLL
ncbi:MAG TPA: DUF58 domain-containing protein, partial [Fimbriimonadaceae bacterium]|nr:DUF58 domain-containing protein [Fimbriimonadaceae bacterium]